jgi:hypothetical protein
MSKRAINKSSTIWLIREVRSNLDRPRWSRPFNTNSWELQSMFDWLLMFSLGFCRAISKLDHPRCERVVLYFASFRVATLVLLKCHKPPIYVVYINFSIRNSLKMTFLLFSCNSADHYTTSQAPQRREINSTCMWTSGLSELSNKLSPHVCIKDICTRLGNFWHRNSSFLAIMIKLD